MTQRKWRRNGPSLTASRRIKELRTRRGWSAERLATACAEAGMPELNRSVIANIENRRRMTLTLEEALTLAYVLDVAPVHLIVPTETDDKYDAESYLVTPEIWTSIPDARAWIRGDKPAGDQDPRTYFSEVPEEDTRLEKPDEDKIDALSEDIRYMQKFLEEAGFINRAREQGDRGER